MIEPVIIGSADATDIMGCGHRTPYRTFLEKTGIIEHMDEPDEVMTAGKALESAVLGLFVARLGGTHVIWKEQPTLFHMDRPWQRATPEALLLRYDRETDQERIASVEIKCISSYPPSAPRVPWVVQSLHQRMVLASHFPEIETHYIVCFGALRTVWWEVPYHVPAMDRILRAEERFLELVESRTPPPVKAEDASLLHHHWPWSRPETVDLADLTAAGVAYAQGSEMTKVGEAMRGRAQAEIEAALQERDSGVFPDGSKVTWRTGKDGRRRFRMTYREESA